MVEISNSLRDEIVRILGIAGKQPAVSPELRRRMRLAARKLQGKSVTITKKQKPC